MNIKEKADKAIKRIDSMTKEEFEKALYELDYYLRQPGKEPCMFDEMNASYSHTGDVIWFLCHVCQKHILPVWELTQLGEKRQVPISKYWKELNKQIWKSYCSSECGLLDYTGEYR